MKKYFFYRIKMSPTSISNALNLKSTEISLRSFYEETLKPYFTKQL